MSSNVLVLEKDIPLEMEGIQIGNLQVQVFETVSPHISQEDMNEKYLVAKGVYHDKTYEVKGIRGGIQSVLDSLKKTVLADLK